MGGVYVWGEDDFACYVGKYSTPVGGTTHTGAKRHGKRIPWMKLSEEEQQEIVWKKRRGPCLNKVRKRCYKSMKGDESPLRSSLGRLPKHLHTTG